MNEGSEAEMQLQIEYEAWKSIKNTQDVAFNDFIHVDDDIVTTEYSTDEDVIGLYRSESMQHDDSLEDDLQQPSNELVVNSLSVLRSYLKANERTSDCLYTSLNRIQAFFRKSK